MEDLVLNCFDVGMKQQWEVKNRDRVMTKEVEGSFQLEPGGTDSKPYEVWIWHFHLDKDESQQCG